jgi:hypothetical protein
VEEEFETHWQRWLDQADQWKPFFLELEALKEAELKTVLQSFNLITDEDSELFSRLRRSAEGRAVPLYAPFTATNAAIAPMQAKGGWRSTRRTERPVLRVPMF